MTDTVEVAQRRLLESLSQMGAGGPFPGVLRALRIGTLADWLHKQANDLEVIGQHPDVLQVLRDVAALATAVLEDLQTDLPESDPRGTPHA